MKYLKNLTSSLLFAVVIMATTLSAYAVNSNLTRRHISPEEEFSNYVEELRQNDVYITLPEGYTPISVRGNADVRGSIGYGSKTNIDCTPPRIGAILEDDSCHVAICFPELLPITGAWSILGGNGVEADLRMAHNDMRLDVRPLVKIIAEEDMSQYANADTVAIYEFEKFNRPFLEHYPTGVGIYLRKKNHPSIQLRLMLDYNSMKDKEKYIREALDNIHFGDNPSETYVELEKQVGMKSDFNFPTKYRFFTGILPDINDETLEEINRVRAWCEAHGIKQLPQLDDEVIDALNRYKASRTRSRAEADSILNVNSSEEKRILKPYMCDTEAHFPGKDVLEGRTKYWDWLGANLRYPKGAKSKGIGGYIYVDFVVCEDGTIKDVAISDLSSKKDASLKQEAIRLVKSMPRWVPATYKGKPVSSYESCIVKFESDTEKKANAANSETNVKPLADERVYDMKGVPVAPKFKGTGGGIAEWIQEHIQYPATAAKSKIEGRVIVEFIIDKDGSVIQPKIIRGINDALNNEAIRVIKSLPPLTPGYSDGKPVKTRYTYPVTFRLAKAK
ncbi:MAG: energy transducer TonB [Muribaculaceae bacterium]|nr:energy transducer TonB [Muribaculaceae bacterium]